MSRLRSNRHNEDWDIEYNESVDQKTDNTLQTEDSSMPPRKQKFPSSMHKVNQWFYRTLFVSFLALVIFLLWIGSKQTLLP